MFDAIVSWPTAPVTKSLVLNALNSLNPPPAIITSESRAGVSNLLQWSTYDDIDHELVHSRRDTVLSSSYTFRKALIRKHFLSRCLHSYVTKHPDSELKDAAPKTFEIELSFVDELDEMFLDELWELGKELEEGEKWWILKPGMADRGNGIRMFNSRADLEKIFEDFEEADSDDEAEDGSGGEEDNTAVVTSQLRHFVIQEYLSNPLLFDPAEVSIDGSSKPDELQGYKFHLRAYCVASGALKLYLFDEILALFSAVPYVQPSVDEDEDGDPLPVDLAPHLTNTSLQTERGEEGVRLFRELISCRVLSGPKKSSNAPFSAEDKKTIVDQMVVILGETFKAALSNPIHFQPLPNVFELFGIDFLVTDSPASQPRFQVKLLEVNAEPAID
ncbi:tubulin-tyrosine ligase/Tubulin polyglutamylase [Mycena rosella]|uniref:Tubulin-tyrosine ligase/Tubulin polyglutamylase n=1 Tax=Mycena rosella TaxID=1033263 RepID=A0AAD7G751_MYCRO|nr:tubulin-tyrosine ligase/Tubulin polyglutamylase [Mycena rosella]